MMFKTHLVFSLFVAVVLFRLSLFSLRWPLFFSVFIFAALLPDIDSISSVVGRKARPFSYVFYVLRHRTIMHSLWVPLFAFFFIALFSLELALAFFIGYFSHLALDMLNYKGIRLFYPFFRIRGFIKAGSVAESAVFVAFFLALLLALFF